MLVKQNKKLLLCSKRKLFKNQDMNDQQKIIFMEILLLKNVTHIQLERQTLTKCSNTAENSA